MLVCVLPRALRLLDDCMVKLSTDKSYPSVAVEEEKKGEALNQRWKYLETSSLPGEFVPIAKFFF